MCIEQRSRVIRSSSFFPPVFTHSYHLLEREYNETTVLLAGPLDASRRNQLTHRQLTIILEAREMVEIMNYPAPRWCAARK
jgi:hypothetical protein